MSFNATSHYRPKCVFDWGEVAFFSAKRWDRRNRADLIESATPCHDARVVGPYRDSNPLRLTILAAMSEDYTTAPQHAGENNGSTIASIVLAKVARGRSSPRTTKNADWCHPWWNRCTPSAKGLRHFLLFSCHFYCLE